MFKEYRDQGYTFTKIAHELYKVGYISHDEFLEMLNGH